MDIRKLRDVVTAYVSRNKFILIILAVGLVLMLIPVKGNEPEPVSAEKQDSMMESFQDSLERILETVEGAGKVRVLLSQATSEWNNYQTDREQSTTAEKEKTVILTGTDRNSFGLISHTDAPIYRGAVIVCQGADNPSVRLAIVEAVADATGLTTDKITVLKMK